MIARGCAQEAKDSVGFRLNEETAKEHEATALMQNANRGKRIRRTYGGYAPLACRSYRPEGR